MSSPSSSPLRHGDHDGGSDDQDAIDSSFSEPRTSEDYVADQALLHGYAASATRLSAPPPFQSEVLDSTDERRTKLKIAAATYSFFLIGFVPSAIGVIIPHLEEHYSLGDTAVSLIFLCPPIGYIVAAYTNSLIHVNYGQRAIALAASLSAIIFTFFASLHPPYFIFLMLAVLYYYGAGLLDGSWSAWAGGMKNANTVQGILHSGLSIGASLGPVLAGTMIEVGKNPWYSWYYVLTPLAVAEAVVLLWAFWHDDGATYMSENHHHRLNESECMGTNRWAPFKHVVTWICGAYFLTYVGSEAAIAGWIVTFMRRVRQADPYLASLCTSFFWIGITLGRLTLGYITDRIGVRFATALYIGCAIILQAVFAFLPNAVASSVMILIIGYFFGPLFPSGLVILTQSLDRSLHVRAVAIAITFGQIGGALIPSGLGALSELIGMEIFQAVIFAWLLVTLVLWLCFPQPPKRPSDEIRRGEGVSDESTPFAVETHRSP
ncbi:major facilitator superfamily domain-containing protein [Xylariomycetidae sp. FL2044]|nr:major facilitator superfamily domain-containing protein [Xylariomycetidae sp. FL2044]